MADAMIGQGASLLRSENCCLVAMAVAPDVYRDGQRCDVAWGGFHENRQGGSVASEALGANAEAIDS